ncbi:MAG TPA: HD domain-containing phosphohydrolase [Chloroflexota bacterium]|nr:HD domain-containing phosphohydrolase [Chloroflexota bacterium]
MAASHMGELTHSESSLAALLCALSFASGLAIGDRMEHGIGSAYIGMRLAHTFGLSQDEREAVYYGALLKDAGCTACASLFGAVFADEPQPSSSGLIALDRTHPAQLLAWLAQGVPADVNLAKRTGRMLSLIMHCAPAMREAATTHCEIAVLFARRLGFGRLVQQTVQYQFERWDGKGMAFHLTGSQLPLATRILSVAQVAELCHGFGGRSLATRRIGEGSGRRFDPDVASTFLSLAQREDFWPTLEQDGPEVQAAVLEMRPPLSAVIQSEDQLDTICSALADFTDLRSSRRWNHSIEVATVAEGIATRLRLSPAETQRTRRAALVHDVGMVTVPWSILEHGDALSAGELEQVRLHAYYTQRVLERVVPLRDLAVAAAAHHEWVQGPGGYLGLRGDQIPLIARIIGLADAYVYLSAEGRPVVDPKDTLARLRPRVGTQFDEACFLALWQVVTGTVGPAVPAHRTVSRVALSEREHEVLRLLTRGLSNPQIAEALVISKKTVEHHLEHIYNKMGISTRTSAVAYAVLHGLAEPQRLAPVHRESE